MLITINMQQAEQAIPDANSHKAAKKLAKTEDWLNKGACADQWIWGEITGSAIYQSAIFLPELKFECSCPSFKRPCKHALGLLLCYSVAQDQFPIIADAQIWPERVKKWIDKKQKAIKKADPSEPPKEVDYQARAKRTAARDKKVDDGMATLQQWLQDTMHLGLARLRADSDSIQLMTSRLADAQATGLTGWLDQLYSSLYQQEWQAQSMLWIARLHLMTQLWQRRAQLDPALQAEMRQLLGFNLPADEFAKLPVQQQPLWVVGKSIGNLPQGNGRYRRQWLWNDATQQASLLLDFEIGGFTSFPPALVLNTQLDLSLQYFPSPTPLRAKITDNQAPLQIKDRLQNQLSQPNGWSDFETALADSRDKLIKNPFIFSSLWVVRDLTFYQDSEHKLWVVDRKQCRLPLNVKDALQFAIAVGDEEFCLVAEWDTQQLDVLGIWQAGVFVCLN